MKVLSGNTVNSLSAHAAVGAKNTAASGANSVSGSLLSRAAEIYISAQGRKLSEAVDGLSGNPLMGTAEARLAALNAKEQDVRENKKQLEIVEDKLKDETLSDNDRGKLEKEKRILKEASQTREDKLAELYGQKEAFGKRLNAGEITADEAYGISRPLTDVPALSGTGPVSAINREIRRLQGEMRDEARNRQELETAANQERADRLSLNPKTAEDGVDTLSEARQMLEDEGTAAQGKSMAEILFDALHPRKKSEKERTQEAKAALQTDPRK
ncbi:MAG: hypothetical protein ACFNUI_07210 [Negativicutes bacterium]